MRTDRYKEQDKNDKAGQTGQRRRGRRRTLRVLLLIIFLLLIAVAGAAFYSYHSAEESLDLTFTEESPSLEFGEEYSAMDFVASHEGDVLPGAKTLSADKLGSGELVYTVSKPVFGGILTVSRDFSLSYTVVDTVAPLALWSGDGSVVLNGSDFDINDVIAYGDNADPAPAVTVDGEVDTTVNGRYPLHVTVTDSSGNSTGWDLTVTVADNVPVYTDNSPRLSFSDFTDAHGGDGHRFGIDVSTWQGDIDFEAVKAAGCDFVIIRIGYSVDGTVNIDSKFEQNYERAKAAGIPMGLYLYSYDDAEDEVRQAADWIIEKLGGDSLDLPIAFDWEDFGNFQEYGMSFTWLNGLYDAFADELEKSGYDCMLYGSKTYLEKVWTKTDTRTVWLAHYTSETTYEGPFMLWQASSVGRIDGIYGDVDLDILYEN